MIFSCCDKVNGDTEILSLIKDINICYLVLVFEHTQLSACFRDGSYAGSRGSFQGPLGGEPHHSGSYSEQYTSHGDPRYHDNPPRYNGGVHYPEDTYNQSLGRPDNYVEYPDNRDGPYDDDPQYPSRQGYPGDQRLDDYPDTHSRGQWEDPYNDSFRQSPPQQQHPNNSFHDLRHDSYQAPPSPDRYSDVAREHHSFDQPGSANYIRDSYQHNQPPSLANDSFHDEHMGDNYIDDTKRRYEGLPPVRADPFSDDPFREQHSRDLEHLRHGVDPYYRGPSPSGGSDIYCSYFYGNDFSQSFLDVL